MVQVVEILSKGKDQLIVHSQYYACWWLGDARSQGINNNDIDLILMDYSNFNNKKGWHTGLATVIDNWLFHGKS